MNVQVCCACACVCMCMCVLALSCVFWPVCVAGVTLFTVDCLWKQYGSVECVQTLLVGILYIIRAVCYVMVGKECMVGEVSCG